MIINEHWEYLSKRQSGKVCIKEYWRGRLHLNASVRYCERLCAMSLKVSSNWSRLSSGPQSGGSHLPVWLLLYSTSIRISFCKVLLCPMNIGIDIIITMVLKTLGRTHVIILTKLLILLQFTHPISISITRNSPRSLQKYDFSSRLLVIQFSHPWVFCWSLVYRHSSKIQLIRNKLESEVPIRKISGYPYLISFLRSFWPLLKLLIHSKKNCLS